MKKALILFLICVISLSLASCKNSGKQDTTAGTTAATTAQNTESTSKKKDSLKKTEPVTNEDGDIVLTCPSSFYDENNPPTTELTEEQKEIGFKKAVVNKDGSLSYIVSRKSFEKIKASSDEDTKKALENYPKNVEYIKSVAASEDFSVINLRVDGEAFSKEVSGFAIIWEAGLYGQLAQVMYGVTPDKLDVTVVVTDAETGDIVQASHYPMDSSK